MPSLLSMANKYNQRKVVGMLRKVAKQEKSPHAALIAIKILMRIEGMGEFIESGRPSLDPELPVPADEQEREPAITAEMLSDLLEIRPSE